MAVGARLQPASVLMPARAPDHPQSSAWHRFLRNRQALAGGVWLVVVLVGSVLGPLAYRTSYEDVNLLQQLADPSLIHPLGTDETGRDILARLMVGGRISLVVSVVAAAFAIVLGTILGALSGYFGRTTDAVIMRVTDTFMSVPLYFFLLTILALFGASLTILVLGIGLTSWMAVARVVRSELLRYREMDFVESARALGVGNARLLRVHLLPQAIPSIIVAANISVAHAILAETSLSFLGIGIQPPLPSWGNMLSGAQSYVFTAPRLAVLPGVLILLTVLALNVLGDGLQDALDPRSASQA